MHDRLHDSAGVPWEGREFTANSFSDDSGEQPIAISQALAHGLDKARFFQALSRSRLLIPLIAAIGEGEIGPHGQLVDKSADLGIVAVATPDGKSAIPVFSSVEAMRGWDAKARPVPIESSRIALAAIAEGHERIIFNPGSTGLALRRPALAALAQGHTWKPPHEDPEVMELAQKAFRGIVEAGSLRLIDADPELSLNGPELQIELGLRGGFSKEQLVIKLQKFSSELQSQRFLELVDSFSLKVVEVS